MIYLDNAATTLKKPPCVAEAVVRAMATMGNSGRSAHQEALDASRVIYRTREQLAKLLGCSAAERVVFTCNSTEALNIAIDGLFAPGDHVLSTDCEHNSVLRPLYRLEGVEVDFLPADRRGCIDYDDFRRLLRPNTRGIVCTHGSNLTGNLLNIRAIGRFAKEHGLLLVVDASQTAGVFDIDMEAMGIDVVCFTGHKSLLGPQGTGGLCIAPGVDIRPFKVGGTGVQTYLPQQPPQYPTRLEAGTLNGHGIAGLSAALDYLEETPRPDPEKLIAACCRVKARCIAADERDDGPRRLLNFGHTFGHAMEALGGGRYTHGECVAAGMMEMLRWQTAHGSDQTAMLARLGTLLERYDLPRRLDLPETAWRQYLLRDKKRSGGEMTIAVLERPGHGVLWSVTPEELLEETRWM